ncbi:MAG: hypothetical protein AAAB20_31070 [Rhizobium sp.]|jgi:hypothetical protein|uniref:hypothetical protein n=1 Tax=Rhizobium sp. TaxID=391 RepID=UPI0005679733
MSCGLSWKNCRASHAQTRSSVTLDSSDDRRWLDDTPMKGDVFHQELHAFAAKQLSNTPGQALSWTQ